MSQLDREDMGLLMQAARALNGALIIVDVLKDGTGNATAVKEEAKVVSPEVRQALDAIQERLQNWRRQ